MQRSQTIEAALLAVGEARKGGANISMGYFEIESDDAYKSDWIGEGSRREKSDDKCPVGVHANLQIRGLF